MKLASGSLGFLRRVLTLFSGSLLGQIVGFLSAFLLTRLFGPEDFAELEWFALILSVGMTLGTGRYERAFLLPKSDSDALVLVRRSFQWGHWTALASAIGVLICWFWAAFRGETVKWWWALVPVGLWLAVAGTILEFWSHREKKAAIVAGSKVSTALAGEGSKLAMGWMSMPSGLILGVVLGHVTRLVHLARGNAQAWKRRRPVWPLPEWQRKQAILRDYKEYPTWIMAGAMMNRVSQWVHVVLLAWVAGPATIGVIGLTRRIVQQPMGILAQAFAPVFYQHLTEKSEDGALRLTIFKGALALGGLAALAVGGVLTLPKGTLVWAFGVGWEDVLPMLELLIPWYALGFVTSGMANVLHRLRLPKLVTFLDGFHLLLVLLGWGLAHGSWLDAPEDIRPEWRGLWGIVLAKVTYHLLYLALIFVVLQRSSGETSSTTTK